MRLWVVTLAFSLPLGVYAGWGAVLAINLKNFGVSAIATGWLGCTMTLSGSLGGIVVGALTDRFRGNMKGAILALYFVATLGFGAFAVIATASPTVDAGSSSSAAGDELLGTVAPSPPIWLYASGVVGGLFLNSTIPLFFELAMETIYPTISEGTGSGLLSVGVTVVQIVYLDIADGTDKLIT